MPSWPKLKYLNLRTNALSKWEEIEKIKVLTSLEVVILSYNPFVNDAKDSYIYQILGRLSDCKKLTRINKHPITNDMRRQSIQYHRQQWMIRVDKEREERERKEREEKERLEREEAAAAKEK